MKYHTFEFAQWKHGGTQTFKRELRVLNNGQILLLDKPNDASLLANTAFSIFCRETLWFLEILPMGTATQLHPVLERENFVLDIGCP